MPPSAALAPASHSATCPTTKGLPCTAAPISGNPWLFVGGCPRSGTTLLQRMLDNHSLLTVANDSHVIPRALEKTSRELVLRAESGASIPLTRELRDAVSGYHRFYRLGVDVADVDRIAGSVDTYQELIRGLFDLRAQHQNKVYSGEKTPDYVRYIPLLLQMFPDSKFIHIVRDGRDVSLSLRQWATPTKGPGRFEYWNTDPIAVCALWWRMFCEQGLAVPSDLNPRVLLVQYERLVAYPQSELERICQFIDLPFETQMRDFHVGRSPQTQPDDKTHSAKKQWLPAVKGLRNWRTDMAPEDVQVFDGLAGAALSRLGYESPSRIVSAAAFERVARATSWWRTTRTYQESHAAVCRSLSNS
ncbi:MAG: sulfotransferase [Planctomycetales bacterium]|nr:sulfotransferase [Planctomycetales bacterium]